MNKLLRIGLAASMLLGGAAVLSACGGSGDGLKVAMVCIGDPNTSTYDKNFKMGLDAAAEELNIPQENVFYYSAKGEADDARQAAIDAAEDGCDVVILNSYGHQYFADAVAQMYPNVKFISCTGDLAHTQNIPNLYNAFANIFEGRYLAGVAAGKKLMEKTGADNHVIGYVAAFPYAEVISGYTAFYLGAKSVCEDVTMKYVVTSDWGNSEKEAAAATALIAAGCDLISQHADTYGAPNVCETSNIPNVSYNVSTDDKCPNTYLCSSRINWTPYFKLFIKNVMDGKENPVDWSKGIKEDSVKVGNLGKCAAQGTQEEMEKAKAAIENGTLHIFDTSKFTVSAENNPFANMKLDDAGHLTSYMADVLYDEDYTADTEAIKDGYFHESEYRSAPYFELRIDGITEITDKTSEN